MSYACVHVVYISVSKIALTYITFSIILSWLSPCAQYAAAVMWFVKYPRLLHIRQKELWSSKREAVKRPFSCFHQSNPSRSPQHELGTPATITAQVFHFIFLSKIHFWCWNSVKALATPSVSVNISVDTCNGPHSYTTHTKSQWSYLASLVFGENCRKIGVNTSGWESIKWWHHQCVSHEVMTSPMSVQSESSICWGGAFPTSWIFITNPLVTSSIFVFISFHLDCFSQLLQIQRLTKEDQWWYLATVKLKQESTELTNTII